MRDAIPAAKRVRERKPLSRAAAAVHCCWMEEGLQTYCPHCVDLG